MTIKLSASSQNPPLGAIIVAELISSKNSKNKINIDYPESWKAAANVQLLINDQVVCDDDCNIGRYLARTIDDSLYGGSGILEKTQVDSWISYSNGPLKNPASLSACLDYLNRNLTKNWLVSDQITLGDIYVFATLIYHNYKQDSQYPELNRWFSRVSSSKYASKVLNTFNKSSVATKSRKDPSESHQKPAMSRKQEGKFVELPGAEMGKVVVRFPPEASGYLHIGHAKAALLNQYYAETFKGTLIMRFDDTNPAKETVEFEQEILQDLKLLDIKADRFTHTSDYFDLMLKYCEQLIREGKAFVDDTPGEIMKEQREKKEPSKNRDNPVDKNIKLWEEMKKGSEKGQACCVRAKIDYTSVNGCMRDPTIYRCKPESHPRTLNKYKVYPTYDFACPIVDSIEGVTHTLRTTEYTDRDPQFFWFIEALGLRRPHIWAYSRLNMTNTVLSKRKLTWFVDNGLVDGWDDPRLPTVRGILRHGLTVEGLKQFIIAQGGSRSVVFMEWDKIWAMNKKIIDPIAYRYTALDSDDLVQVNVLDAADNQFIDVQNHPKNPEMGTRKVLVGKKIFIERVDAEMLKAGEKATFITWGNLMIDSIKKSNGKILEIDARLKLDDKDYKNTVKLTWLAEKGDKNDHKKDGDLIPCIAVYFDHIISKNVLGKDDDFKDFIAKNTRKEVKMFGEAELKNVKQGEIIQLQRKGFFRCDVTYAPMSDFTSRERPLILFYVPDGHTNSSPISATASKETSNKETSKSNKANAGSSTAKSTPAVDGASVLSQIKNQGDKIRALKSSKADKKVIEEEVKALLSLKAEFKKVTGVEWKPDLNPADFQSSAAAEPSAESINQQIVDQGNKVRELKSAKADKAAIDESVKVLLSLKAEYKAATGKDWKPESTPKDTKEVKNKNLPKMQATDARNADELNKKIVEQGNKVRELKSAKADKAAIDESVKILLGLKAEYKAATGKDWKPESTPNPKDTKEAKNTQNLPKVQTGAGDADDLSKQIADQGNKVRELKSAKADKATVDENVKVLLKLKADYKAATGEDWKPPASAADGDKKKKSKAPEPPKASKQAPKAAKEVDSTKTGTRLGLEAKKSENLPDWYSQVITKGEMIEYYDVSGCYILRPWSYSIWDKIKDFFDTEIKKLGVQNCYFPIFVSKAVLEREKTHIADFAPEVAWVTKSGDSDLAEPIAIRPTSETVMYPAYAKWIQSYRDLPLKLNQWNNVVRWEFKHPQPFLRTREFLWQEGHSAFLTKPEADEEVLIILDLYRRIYEEYLAIPVVRGRKTEKEKFAGGDYTTTVEAFVSASGRAIQGGTSHHLGQNFSKMFDIKVEGVVEGGDKTFVYQNSWGLTTRTIGVMVMVHGDDKGLVLPPNVASVQIIIIPCGITATTTAEERANLLAECTKLEKKLADAGLRVKGDYRDNYSPGWKFNHWELKGVPLRVELGFKDLEKSQVTFVRRDTLEKSFAKQDQVCKYASDLLNTVQKSMFDKAKKELDDHIKSCQDWNSFCKHLDQKNLILAPFCGRIDCEDEIKKDSARDEAEEAGAPLMGAKGLCIPFDQPKNQDIKKLKCIHPKCGQSAQFWTLFGRSY
ncbi:bifunctional glutamate/proline--tRNA ligase [Microplitis demolitor]|uniref:bifunctional glutamate/proline--tRNA ligase n=1 Tax=Microplitis demolitor TaxID=69319 RepID=UPI00044002B1|nr:bifunctional glutamate/proline--tRNA ligase [Microplitis demolitor]